MDYAKKWEFAIEAYTGDGGFDSGSYLDKHSRESETKYAERQKITKYSNIFVQKVGRYIGYLYKKEPIRASENKMIKAIFDDADNAGNSMSVFMSGFSKKTKVRGVGLILVDNPSSIPDTLDEQLKQRALPYLVTIAPEKVTEYKLDKFGKFEYVAYADTIDNSTYQNPDIQEVIRYYDREKWVIYDKAGDEIDRGDHNLGVCPVVYVGENGVFPDVGEFTQVANLAKRHFNLESEMDDIMRGQTFSILTLNSESPSDTAITLSTDNAIKYGKGLNAPSFIAPDVSPADTYENKINAIETRMDEITYDISTGLQAEAGIALDIKFQGLNGSLSNYAMRLEDLEIRIMEIILKYLKISAEYSIMYPKTFNITDMVKEIEILDKIKRMGYTIRTYEAVKLKKIIGNDLSTISPDEMDEITTEIDDIFKENV